MLALWVDFPVRHAGGGCAEPPPARRTGKSTHSASTVGGGKWSQRGFRCWLRSELGESVVSIGRPPKSWGLGRWGSRIRRRMTSLGLPQAGAMARDLTEGRLCQGQVQGVGLRVFPMLNRGSNLNRGIPRLRLEPRLSIGNTLSPTPWTWPWHSRPSVRSLAIAPAWGRPREVILRRIRDPHLPRPQDLGGRPIDTTDSPNSDLSQQRNPRWLHFPPPTVLALWVDFPVRRAGGGSAQPPPACRTGKSTHSASTVGGSLRYTRSPPGTEQESRPRESRASP